MSAQQQYEYAVRKLLLIQQYSSEYSCSWRKITKSTSVRRICGFRVRGWKPYRTYRSSWHAYESLTELTEVPGTELTEVPGTELTEVPGTELTEVPGTELTEVPGTELTEVPVTVYECCTLTAGIAPHKV